MDVKARHSCLILMLLASTGIAHAQTAGELADIQAQTLIAKARAELKKAQGEADSGAGSPIAAASAGGDALPVVSGIYGRDGALYARFLYASGIDYQARAGMTAPGGYVVKQVSDDRVVLSKDGKTYTLGFSDVRPTATAAPATQQTSFPNMSPMSPIVGPSPGSMQRSN